MLWKLRKFLPAKILLNLYNALIKPHLLHSLVIRGSTDPCSTQQPIQLLLNKTAVRAITGISRFEHITPSFRQLEILKIHDSCKIEIALNMHKFKTLKFLIHFRITLLLQVMYITTGTLLEVSFNILCPKIPSG